MNIIDSALISQVNGLSRLSMSLDLFMGFLAHNPLLKGGVLATIIWWLWSRGSAQRPFVREHIITTVLLCFPSIVLARGLAAFLPFRLRPMHEVGLGFTVPYGVDLEILDGWSSFPSDHAVLFFTLATGLFFVSRGIGAFAFAYVLARHRLPACIPGPALPDRRHRWRRARCRHRLARQRLYREGQGFPVRHGLALVKARHLLSVVFPRHLSDSRPLQQQPRAFKERRQGTEGPHRVRRRKHGQPKSGSENGFQAVLAYRLVFAI